MNVKIFTDGGARGNPGPAGIGGIVYDDAGSVLAQVSEYIGTATNNQAEYTALWKTLSTAKNIGAQTVDCYLDSELVVKQMNREYRVKDQHLAKIFLQIHQLISTMGAVKFFHIPRERNAAADALVNQAIDRATRTQ
ncbi:MAG: ribonuclease HI family protein [Candidatus Kerfeldbacteria bacterium]|nr:ribonuclease HI family protein [Candidatus Kerfeldbacteria bacterium]